MGECVELGFCPVCGLQVCCSEESVQLHAARTDLRCHEPIVIAQVHELMDHDNDEGWCLG